MTPSAVAKLVAEWRKAIVKLKDGLGDTPSYDLKRMIKERSEAFTICADELEALATAPPEQAAWRIKCPNCGVTQSHDCKTLGERMGDGAPAQFLQNIENILGRCVFDQPDSLTYDEGVAAVKALPELADPPQPASDGALDAEIVNPYPIRCFSCGTDKPGNGHTVPLCGDCYEKLRVALPLASHDQKVRAETLEEAASVADGWSIDHDTGLIGAVIRSLAAPAASKPEAAAKP